MITLETLLQITIDFNLPAEFYITFEFMNKNTGVCKNQIETPWNVFQSESGLIWSEFIRKEPLNIIMFN